MRIYGCCVVRNEDDFIETFLRYHSFLDCLFITDNGSTDRTCEMIRSVMEEDRRCKIVLLHHDGDFDQEAIVNQMMHRMMSGKDVAKPDIIIPLDADELIAAAQGSSIRKQLEEIDRSVISLIRWHTYMPAAQGDGVYLPAACRYCRKAEHEYLTKVIIPTELIDESFRILCGNHTVFSRRAITLKRIDHIFMAHYPVRSVFQLTKKVVTGYAKRISSPTYTLGASKQAELLFERFMEQGCFSGVDLLNEAYGYFSASGDVYSAEELEYCPIDLSDADTELRFSSDRSSVLQAITRDYVRMAFDLRRTSKIAMGIAEGGGSSRSDPAMVASERLEEMRLKKNIALEEANAALLPEVSFPSELSGKKVWVFTYTAVGERIAGLLSQSGVEVRGLVMIHGLLNLAGIKQVTTESIADVMEDCDGIVVYTQSMQAYVRGIMWKYPWENVILVKPTRGKA